MAQASTSRLGICQTCHTNPARYSCPACSFPSCSLACSTSHKTAKECTGIAPPVWSRSIQANEMDWGSLMRDQSYIAGVGRAIEEVGRQLVGDKLIPQGRRLGADETVRLDERSEKEDKLVREARNQGVELMLLPKGMSKRLKNGTRWDAKKQQLEWTIDVTFQPRPTADRTAPEPESTSVTIGPIPSSKTLQAVLQNALTTRDKKGKGKEVDPEEATWRLAQRAWLEAFAEPVMQGHVLEVPEEMDSVDLTEDRVIEEGIITEEGSQTEAVREEGESGDPEEKAANQEDAPAEEETAGAAPPIKETKPEPPSTRRAPPSDDSPFILLLAFHARPVYPETRPDGSQPSPPAKSPGRSVYQIQPDSAITLRETIAGSTLLEHPSFEIWPKETFLRQKLLGKIKVVDQPRESHVRERAQRTWDRGRGRGSVRGRGSFTDRGRGRGRGGGGGHTSSNGYGPGSSRMDDNRSQDSGWGKRSHGNAEQHGDSKRMRTEP
ncbi:uncharacterized protein JCM15063_003832 [Sporobolomyces koalae]|uniref:uncharacterized protein n=1 Tax=Sporobolomyces koalae TaxID=500713 RepID=UPI003172F9F9